LVLSLPLLIQPPSILFPLNPSLLVGITLLVLRLSIVVAALLVFGLSSLLLLRLSFAIAALIFSLAPLLVLRLSIGVPALFLRLSSLLLFLLVVLPLALGLILVVALLPLFAVLCPLTPTALSVYFDHRAQHGHDAENEQKGKSIDVIHCHDYLQFRREG